MKYEPNALHALARVSVKVAEYCGYIIILACIALAWIGSPT